MAKRKKKRKQRRRQMGDVASQMIKTSGDMMVGAMAMGTAAQVMNLVKK